jgi:2-polyprenyl-6-hydroxyphenyl methylase/3-demethylubiquinone-9 3-methyltransferase
LAADDQHTVEVARGERFEFGKNWTRFLRVLNEDRIRLAESSLTSMLQMERLDGLSFLDIGSGSGLFSLAARRLGATVRSFDYDPQSVACTRELKRRYFDGDTNWTIERASVLDQGYLAGLGTFDIVYSWGVLHHTGSMWKALDNVKPLVRIGGKLFIAIYNDQGEVTDRWAAVKRRHGRLPAPLARLYALAIIAGAESRSLAGHMRRMHPAGWMRSWTDYDKESARGMSKWHDWLDWIGGYPYERATAEQIVDHYAKDGFRLCNLVDRSFGYGCNEFVFSRDAPAGTLIRSPIPGSPSLVRRFGWPVLPPFAQTAGGWMGTVPPQIAEGKTDRLWLFRSDVLVGPAKPDPGGRVLVAEPGTPVEMVSKEPVYVVPGQMHSPPPSFRHERGHMWAWDVPDLEDGADSVSQPTRSAIFVLQDGRQLSRPHALHDEIAKWGDGRFSHWGRCIYFAPRGNESPSKTDRFRLFVPFEVK